MTSTATQVAAILEPAVAAVRRVLRDLEAREVPVSLRRVAAKGGGRLTPPLLRSVLIELDRNDWLREKTLEELGDEVDGPAALFLAAEPGWWLKLADAVADAVTPEADSDDTEAVANLEGQLAEAKRRSGDLREERDRLTAELRTMRRNLRDRPQTAHGEADGQVAVLGDQVRQLTADLDAERALRIESETRLAEIRRRSDRRKTPRPEGGSSTVRRGADADAIRSARRLDLDMAAFAAAVPAPPDPRHPVAPSPGRSSAVPGAAEPLLVPPGIAPDSAEAVIWLLGLTRPVTVVVDGYNVTFLIDREHFASGELRRRLIGGASRLRRRRAAHRVIVVFDSHEATDGDIGVGPGGVEVRFSPAHMIADDEIVELARSAAGPVVVISNDRDLRERSEAVGAITLWGAALVEWLGEGS